MTGQVNDMTNICLKRLITTAKSDKVQLRKSEIV